MPLIYEGMELQANTFEREGRLYEKDFDPIPCHAHGMQILIF